MAVLAALGQGVLAVVVAVAAHKVALAARAGQAATLAVVVAVAVQPTETRLALVAPVATVLSVSTLGKVTI